MKRTLQIVSAALLLTVASVTAQAQGGSGGGMGRGQMQRDMMFKDITLTPAQTAQIDSAFATAQTKQTGLGMVRGTPPTEEQTKARAAIMADRTAAIKKILTADQFATYEKNMAAMPQGRGRGGL